MKIDYAILADAAQAVGGKIFILGGGWNVFRSPNFPAPAQFAVAIGLGFAATEIGVPCSIKIVIADEAGVPIVPELNGQIETGQLAPDLPAGLPVKVPVAWNVNLALPRPGRYGIVVTAGSSQVDLSFSAVFIGQRVQFPSQSSSPPPSERGN